LIDARLGTGRTARVAATDDMGTAAMMAVLPMSVRTSPVAKISKENTPTARP